MSSHHSAFSELPAKLLRKLKPRPAGLRSHDQQGRRRDRFSAYLLLITFIGLLLRLAVVWELRHTRAVIDPLPGTDMRTYWNLAAAIISGQLPEQFYYQPFYYSVFLPSVILFFRRSALALGIVQAVIGGATIWLVGWIGGRLFGSRSGLFAAVGLALARFHVFYTPFALMAVLQGFWLTSLVGMVVWQERRSRYWQWALFGLLFGCANLTRGNIIILVPGVGGVLIWQYWGHWRKLAGCTALFLFFVLAVQAPFSWYNWRQTGRWSGPSTAAGAVLALGNNPEAPPGGLVYTRTYEHWMEAARRQDQERITVARSILNWVREEPLAWFELKFRAALLFWSPLEIPNNVSIEHEGTESGLLGLPLWFDFRLIAIFGLGGTVICLISPAKRRRLPVLFTVYCLFAYFVATVLFYILARFRIPAVPVLCIFAGYSLHRCWGEIQVLHRRGLSPRRKLQLAVVLLPLLLSALFVVRGLEFYQQHLEAGVVRRVRPHGVLALDGERTVVYDHGPKYLGGWNLFPLPANRMQITVDKTFSLPSRSELDELKPRRLRIPMLVQAGAQVQLEVFHNGQSIGREHIRVDNQTGPIQWFSVDLATRQAEDSTGNRAAKTVDFHVVIAVDSSYPAHIWVDRQRNYGRTRLHVPDLSTDFIVPGFEACFQLIFN